VSALREAVITRGLPLPLPGLDDAAFYEAARRGELRFQRCSDCGVFRHYPRPICPACQSTRHAWELSSGSGVIHSWTIVHGPTLPAFQDQLPYNVVDVLLDEGVHFQSQLLDCPPDEIRAGMRVQAVFVTVSEDIALVKFRRARSAAALDEAFHEEASTP
jgi:hypothetical protein